MDDVAGLFRAPHSSCFSFGWCGCSVRYLSRLTQSQQQTLAGTLVANLQEGGSLHKSARKLILLLASLPAISPQILLSLLEAPAQAPQPVRNSPPSRGFEFTGVHAWRPLPLIREFLKLIYCILGCGFQRNTN